MVVYAKLPKSFFIPTPVGNYSPDWAIAFKQGTVKHIYFIAETKGSMSTLDLREIEDCKIKCARKFFAKITSDQVRYDIVDSYTKLASGTSGFERLDIVPLVKQTMKHLHLLPEDIPDTAKGEQTIKAVLGNLAMISQGIAELRNLYGRQVSLSKCLTIWLEPLPELTQKPRQYPWQKPDTQAEDLGHSDGRLILAWANLGSLVEGTMKFGLSVFANDYDATPVIGGKEKTPLDPDGLQLERLRQFYNQHFWIEQQRNRWNKFVELVQKRRNAIHSYRDHDIGDWREFYVAVKNYLVFLSVIEGRVPYTDELPTEY